MGGGVELSQVQTGLCACDAANGVNLDPLHARQIDHHAGIAHRSAADVVAAAANRDEKVPGSGKIDGRDDIVRSGATECGSPQQRKAGWAFEQGQHDARFDGGERAEGLLE